MNNSERDEGFTLIELIVGLCVFSLLIGFSFPVFRNVDLFSSHTAEAGKLAMLIQNLKREAIENDRDYYLHMEVGSNRVMVSEHLMREENCLEAEGKSRCFDDRLTITGIAFDQRVMPEKKGNTLFFSRQGFSDFAHIHCTWEDKAMTFRVEPFLFSVQIMEGHKTLDGCR